MFFNKPLLDGLFEDVALTNSQWKRSLILSSVYTMLSNDDPYVDLLDTFLTYKERLHCSESLLLTKKWGDFLVRFSKQHVSQIFSSRF